MSYEWPIHGTCEPRSVDERREALISEVAEALHRNVCDPRCELIGIWDRDRAVEMVEHFESVMAADT